MEFPYAQAPETAPYQAVRTTPAPSASEAVGDAVDVIRVCDIVLGPTSVLLAVYGTVSAVSGNTSALTAVLLWSFPIFNSVWSALSAHKNRMVAEAVRVVVALPITTFLYMTHGGPFDRFWISAGTMVIAQGVIWGCLTRRALPGLIITILFGGAILVVGCVGLDGGGWHAIKNAAGILMTGFVLSVVSSQLGRSVHEARCRRDEAENHKRSLEAALDDLTVVHEQLDAVLDCAPASILAVDRNGRIEFASGVKPGESWKSVIGAPVLESVLPEARDLFAASMNAVLETGSPKMIELRGRSGDGREVCHAAHLGAMRRGEDVVGLVVVSQEVTELKNTQAAVISAQRMAAIGTLAAGIAHEINTPIQFVSDSTSFLSGAARDIFELLARLQDVRRLVDPATASPELIKAATAATDAEANADLPYLVKNVPAALSDCMSGLERVATIVRSMKEFAHRSGSEMEAVDLNHAIQNTLTIARSEYRDVADIDTTFGEIPLVRCFVNDVNQVILNLVVNAAHAVAEAVEGTSRRGTISIETRLDGEDVVIQIRDTGIGIDSSVAPRIFEPFFTTKKVGKGTGQGLALVWRIIKENHRGDVTFDTKLGEGTTFRVRLSISGKGADKDASPARARAAA